MRRAVLLLLLAGLLVPGPAAQACDVIQLDTLEVELPAAPAQVRPGQVLTVPLRVTRLGSPAPDVEVFLALDGPAFGVFKSGATRDDGRALLVLSVPRSARGPLELEVQVHRGLVDLPCASIEEYHRSARPWGRAG